MPFLTDFIKRWQLERKGLSSGKKRKQNEEDTLANSLDSNVYLRSAVFITFMLGMLAMSFQMCRLGIYAQSPYIKLVKTLFVVIALVTVFMLNHRDKLPKTRLLVHYLLHFYFQLIYLIRLSL